MGRHIVERGWRDAADRILKRRQDVKRQSEGIGRHPFGDRDAYRGHETGALAVGDQLLRQLLGVLRRRLVSRRLGARCLAARGPCRSQRQACQRDTLFQEPPAIASCRIHGSLLRRFCLRSEALGQQQPMVAPLWCRVNQNSVPRPHASTPSAVNPAIRDQGVDAGYRPS